MSALSASLYNLTSDLAVIKFLVQCGADVNQKNSFGETVITFLFHIKRYAEIRFIIAAGLNLEKLKLKEKKMVRQVLEM